MFAGLRRKLGQVGAMHETWSGIPMPLEGERLVIEPTYPRAQGLMAIGAREVPDDEPPDGHVRNIFWSWRKRCSVVVVEKPDGKITWGLMNGHHHLDQALRTMGCSVVWGLEQENKALQLLASLLTHHAFKMYSLTGMFLETSPRSGVTYLFRKLRPTMALHAVKGEMRIMCALCMHPIGYYADSWAGAMCPTDDVIAHLMLMRGDEPMLWRRCQQHPAWMPNAGI